VRRLLIVLLLAWLPLQSAWAAVSVYCGHETAGAMQEHAGHHEHQHDDAGAPQASNLADNSNDGDRTGANHPDCSVCHASAALSSLDAQARATHAGGALPPFVSISLPVPPLGAPDRPNWRSA
jgi:hypothetical protein